MDKNRIDEILEREYKFKKIVSDIGSKIGSWLTIIFCLTVLCAFMVNCLLGAWIKMVTVWQMFK